MKKKNKGFSLLELLATLFIISIIFIIGGSYIFHIINTSKDKSNILSQNNIKTATRTYAEEYPNEIIWIKQENNTYISCIPIQELINKGYLKKADLEKLDPQTYIILTKNSNETIINEEIDQNQTCANAKKSIPIPTKDLCSNPTYNGENQNLIKENPNDAQYIQYENNEKTDAGEYTITVKLKDQENFIWQDGTINDKTIKCSIKKAVPIIEIDPKGSNPKIGTVETTLKSSISGTISIKSSNNSYATATTEDYTITANNSKIIKINILSTRKITTYITITVTPNEKDAKNYYSGSTTYTIDKINYKVAKIPTANNNCKNLTYTGYNLTLTQNQAEGYNFYDNYGINAGKYTVTAKLKYGYVWNQTTNDTTDKTITCKIQPATPTLTIYPTEQTVIKKESTTVSITPSTTGDLVIENPSPTYITTNTQKIDNAPANTRQTIILFGKEAYSSQKYITIKLNPTSTNYQTTSKNFYLKINTNQATLKYNNNKGKGCTSKTIYYREEYGELCTPNRDSYKFLGWYTEKEGGSPVTEHTKLENTKNNIPQDQEIFAHWTPKQYTVTYNSNGGSTCDPKTLTSGDAYGDLCTTSKSGYTFVGWYTSLTGGTKINSTDKVTSSHTIYAHWRENVYQINVPTNDKIQEYQDTLANAVSVAQNGGHIILLKNYADNSEPIIKNKLLGLELVGHTLNKIDYSIKIDSNSTLIISGGSNGRIATTNLKLLFNNLGKLEINTVQIDNSNFSDTSLIENHGILDVKSPSSQLIVSGNIINNIGGIVNITAGALNSYNTVNAAINNTSGTLNFSNATLTSDKRAIYSHDSNAKLNIESGTITNTNLNEGHAINNGNGSTTTITGGTITNWATSNAAIGNHGTLTVAGGSIESKNCTGITNYQNLIVTGGTIKGGTDSPKRNYNGISGEAKDANGTVTINGTITISKNPTDGEKPTIYGYANAIQNSQRVKISGGTFSSGTQQVIYNNTYGKMVISGGSFNGHDDNATIYNTSNNDWNPSDNSFYKADNYSGSLIIEGNPTITSKNKAAIKEYETNDYHTRIRNSFNGTIQSNCNEDNDCHTISGKIYVNGGTIKANNKKYCFDNNVNVKSNIECQKK